MWGTKRVDFHLNWPKWFGWEAGFGFWAMYVWANLLNRRHLSSAEQSSSRKEATADDSDNGASGYTDWDCIFHLHFKMQMSRRVVLWISFPSPSETSSPPTLAGFNSRMPRWRRCALICMPALFGFVIRWLNG